ncbi:uncharacterized protein LOC129581331 [Paramacrobiotus metropolitanus]|uniref:uncharacterized protein LOC129581331 n=1 Tax=Paramacrobiotus metropolitanus TaxID=2943436 RepID=UPI002446116F|nr:uncharacterized protein LOC129581331 [Paramacrobiotus metropolitanus]
MAAVNKKVKELPHKVEEKITTKVIKSDHKLSGLATFKEGATNRACYVEEVLLNDDPELVEALRKSKNLLEKTVSEETINQVFNKKRTKPPAQLAQFDTLCQPLNEDPINSNLLLIPIGSINPGTRFTTTQVLSLRGTLGYNENEVADHATKLGRSLYVQQKETYNCDAKLSIGGETVVGHKAVLAAFSSVLSRLYTSKSTNEVESLQDNVHHISADPKALQKVILWMYTGNIKLSDQSEQIRQIAQCLNMPYLSRAVNEKEGHGRGSVHGTKEVDPFEKPSADSLPAMECDPKYSAQRTSEALVKLTRKSSFAQLISKTEDGLNSAGKPDKPEIRIPQERIRVHRKAQKFGAAALYGMLAEGLSDLTPQQIYELLSSNHICVKTEVDVYEAAAKWLKADFDDREKYLNQMMECPRWVHMSECDFVQVRALDPQFFHHKVIQKHVARAKWFQDLQKRSITWKEYKVPKNRVNEACGLVNT